jgi:hypothetical protein
MTGNCRCCLCCPSGKSVSFRHAANGMKFDVFIVHMPSTMKPSVAHQRLCS